MRWNNQEPTAINQQIQYRNEILKYCLTQIQSDSSIRTHGGNHSHIVMTKQMQYKISAILAKFAKRQISQYWDTFVSDMLNFVQYGKDVQDMEYTIITSNICILTCTCLLEDCLLTDFNHSETLPSNRKHDIMEMVTNQLNVLLSMCYKVIYDNATLYMTSTTSPCRQIAADLVNNGLHMLIPLTAVCSTPNDLFNDDLDFSVILLQCVAIEAFQEKAILLLQSITTTHVNKLSYAILVKLLKQLPNCHICHSIETSGGDGQIPLEPSDWTDHDLYIYKLYTSSVCGLITNNLDTITNYMEIELTKPPASGISMNELLYHFFQMLSKLIGNENPSRRILCESMKSIIAWCKSDVLWKVCGQPPSLMHPGTNSQYSWFYEFIQCVCLPALHSKLKTIRYSVNKYNGEQDEEPVDDEIACMEFDNHTDYIDFQSGFKSYYRLLCNVLVKACPEMCVTYVYQQLLQLTANNVNSNATTVWCKDYKDVVGLMNMEPGHSQLQSNLNPHTLCVTTSTGRSSIVYEWNLFHLMYDALINKLPYDAFLELERGVSSTNSGSNKALGEHVTLESICRIKSMLIKTVDSLLDMVTSSSNHNGLPTVDSDALVLLEYIRCIDSTGSCLKYLIDAQRTHGSNGCDMSSYLIRTISMLLERMYYSETPLVHELNWLQMHGIGLEGTQKQIDCSRIGIGVGLSAAGVIQWLQNKLVECGSTTSSTGWNSSNSQLNGDDGVSTLIHHFEDRSQQVRKRVAGGISSILDVTITCLYSADNFELLSQLFNQIHQAILSGRLSHLQTLSMYATMVTIYQQIPNEYPNKLNILQQIVENVIQRLCHSVDVQHIVENPHYLMQAVIMEYTVKSNNNAENGDSKHAKSVYRELLDCLSIVVAICRKITPPEYSECMPQLWNRDYIGNMQHGSGTHCSAAVDTIQQLVPNLPTCVQQHLLQQTHTTPMAKISAMHDMLYKQLLFNIVWDQIYELLITLFDTFHTLFSVSMRQDPRYQDARIQHAFCFPVRLTSAYVTIPLTNASHIMHSNAFTRDIDTPIGCVDSCAMRTGLDELRVHIYTLFQYINKHKYTYLHNTHDGNRYELSALNQKHQHCLVAHLESMDNVHLTSFIKLVLDSYIYNAPPYYLNTHYYSVDQLVINNQDTVNNHQYSNSIIGQVTKVLYTHMCTRLSTIYSEIDLQNTNPIYCSNYQFCHINPELFGNIPDRQMVVDNIKLNIINELGRTYIDSLMLYSGYVTSSNSNVSHSNDDQQTVICRQHLKSRKEALYAILMHVGLSPGISHTASINTTTPSRELFYLFISNTMLLLSAEDSFVCRKCIQVGKCVCMCIV